MNGMPMLKSQDQAILARLMVCTPIPFRNDLDANEMKVFHLKGSNLDFCTLTFVDSKCSGLFCNGQHLGDGRKACGYFSHKLGHSCIAMQMNFLFTTQNTETRSLQLQNENDAYDDIIDLRLEYLAYLMNEEEE
eukprot:12576644-Ditylum_brightwellii.AAC.1